MQLPRFQITKRLLMVALALCFGLSDRGIAEDDTARDKMIADYTEAIRIDPKDASAYFNRSYLWQEKGEHDKAIADLDEGIRLDPKVALAYYNRGYSWQQKGSTTRRSPISIESIRLDPKATRTASGSRIFLGKKRDHTQGDRRLHRGHPARPQGGRRYSYPRRLVAGEGGARQGDRRLHQAIRLDPKNTVAYYNRGYSGKKEEHDKAIADYTRPSDSIPRCQGIIQRRRLRGSRRGSTTRRSPTSPRPSDSIPTTPMPILIVAIATVRRARTTRRSPITTKPSGSIQERHSILLPRLLVAGKERARQGNRRLRGGRKARSEVCHP